MKLTLNGKEEEFVDGAHDMLEIVSFVGGG
ncbi:MAG: hypothetical protein K0Q75_2724 [Anaerospora sp.]|nr:hypothetical protein [Anaerospora sp.]